MGFQAVLETCGIKSNGPYHIKQEVEAVEEAGATIQVKQEVEAMEEAGATIHKMNLRMQFLRPVNGR